MEDVTFSDVVLTILIGLVGWAFPTIAELKRNVRELHRWHAPDAGGRQMWKNPDLAEAIAELIVEIRGLRGDFKDVIPKLSEEHRSQNLALGALKEQVAEVGKLVKP